MNWSTEIRIGADKIGLDHPTYFIADIAANHDGDLQRAKELIYLAKEAGANCVKFQHFLAEKIVSDYGFRHLKTHQSHQSSWHKSVFDVYKDYECKRDWTLELVETAHQAQVEFMTTPYDFEILSEINDHVRAYKIGSGDITWHAFLDQVALLGKPVLLACGASEMADVEAAIDVIGRHTNQIVLMQCNTNYTADIKNFKYINLTVLNTFKNRYPGMILGLSDHTMGSATVLGAVTLGARVIEKHFTDDNSRVGPDHKFAMNPTTWAQMVQMTRELEQALGDGIKRVEGNEQDTVIVQRRCLRLTRDLAAGAILTREDLESLRPAPSDAFLPYELDAVVGQILKTDKQAGDALYRQDVEV